MKASGQAELIVSDRRDVTLDSIRGVAAFVVLVHHCFSSLTLEDQRIIAPFLMPVRVVMLGKPAVVLFFVLSGMVLSFGFMGKRRPDYGSFLIRRMCRIYIPFAASILLSAALYIWIQPGALPDVSPWFNEEIWSSAPSSSVLMGHLLMLNAPFYSTLNNAMWSLCVEIRASAIFPFLFRLMNSARPWAAIAFIAACLAAFEIGLQFRWAHFPYFDLDVVTAVLQTLYYVPAFMLGVLLALHRESAIQFIGANQRLKIAGLLIGWVLMNQDYDLLNMVGAASLILVASSSPAARRILSARPVLWLGRISYSLYLVHLLVLATVLHGLHNFLPSRVLILAAGLLSLFAAQAFYSLVEEPSHRLARSFGARRPVAMA